MVDPAITRFLAALEETQYLAPDRMQAYQRRLLDRLLRHARSETAFYADRLAPVFRPDDSIDWDRWTEIPILTRVEAQANQDALVAPTMPPVAGDAIPALTSGSTGRPLRHWNTAMQNIATVCANERVFRWHNIDPRALEAAIVDTPPGTARYPDGMRSTSWRIGYSDIPAVSLSIDTLVGLQVEWLRRVRPAIVTSFPSNLREIGKIAREQGAPLDVATVSTLGEAVFPTARAEIRDYFGRDPVDRYGSTEIGHIAATCPHSGKHHIAADLVLIEIVDEAGKRVRPGTAGRIVATSFYNLATPFIRYDTGDYAAIAAEACGCGRTLPLLEPILGRSRNIFRFADGTSALPVLDAKEVWPFVPHRQFQVVQTALDRIEYRYVPHDPQQHNDLAGLTAFVRERLHPSLAVDLVAVDEIKRSPSGKYEDYISLVQSRAR